MIPFATPFFNAAPAGGGGGGGAIYGNHRFWRINITAVGSGTLAAIAELQLYDSAFGPNRCTGGAAGADSTFDVTYPSSDAFDGGLIDEATVSNTSVWASANTPLPHRLDYGFGIGVEREIVQVGMHGRSSANTSQNPTAFDVQYSDDNSSWTTAWSVSGLTWSANEYKRMTSPSYAIPSYSGSPHGSHNYWRVYFNQSSGSAGIVVGEVEFRASPGGADQATGGTATASSVFSGSFAAANAFDDDPSTAWAVASGRQGGWLQYQFASAVSVAEISVKARASGSPVAGPTNMCVQWSDDGALWTSAWSVSGEAAWSLGEVRTFTDPNYI